MIVGDHNSFTFDNDGSNYVYFRLLFFAYIEKPVLSV